MYFNPLPVQELAIPWLQERKEAALFAGMGLGKSASTLAAAEALLAEREIKGVLIVAPLRVATLTWPHEIKKWENFRWMQVANLRTKEGMKAWREGSADVYLINYEMLPKFVAAVKDTPKDEWPAQLVVWDELTKAKSYKSKRIKAFRLIRGRFDYHWGLTGTPRPNGVLDLFAQIRLLDGGKRLGKSFHAFKQTYFMPDNPYSQWPKWVPRDGVDEYITKKISDLALVLRSEDWLDIPPTYVEDLEVALPAKAQKVYKELLKEFLAELENGDEIVAINAAVRMNKLLQVTSGAVYDEDRKVNLVHDNKIKALKKFQKENPEPLLVATSFIHEQERILKACPGAEKFSEGSLDRWERGEIKMIVADPRSIGHGTDRLQNGGKTTVWFSPIWSRELYDQFNARLARTGQGEETRIVRILCPGTVDDAVVETLRDRGEGQDGFMEALKNLQEISS